MKPVIIFNAQGIGKVVLDILHKNKLIVYGFLDDNPALKGARINEVPVLGTMQDEQFLSLLGTQCAAFVAIEEIKKRMAIIKLLAKKADLKIINAIHPNTSIAEPFRIGDGNLIHVATSIGPEASIGNYCSIGGHTMLGHDVCIHDFVHIGAGTIVNPSVVIESNAYIGTGSTLLAGVKIGKGMHIKPCTLVEKDVI